MGAQRDPYPHAGSLFESAELRHDLSLNDAQHSAKHVLEHIATAYAILSHSCDMPLNTLGCSVAVH